MNPNSNPQYNVIRGLTILIGDIRNCPTKQQETKRVEFELDKIRKKFTGKSTLSGYDKKKYVWKLVYIYILGYEVDFGHNFAADLITSIKFSEKITGYIAMSVLFKESNSEIGVMVNSIKNDLTNQNALCQSMALTLASNLNNSELLTGVAKEVVKFMVNYNEKQPNTVKKALITLTKVLRNNKEIHVADSWCKALVKISDMKNFEILLALTGLVINIFQTVGTNEYESLAAKLFSSVLMKIKETPEEYKYYHIRAPWLQIKILQIMQWFHPSSFKDETYKQFLEYIEYIYKKTAQIAEANQKYSRFYAQYCIFFETVNFIDHFSSKVSSKMIDNYIRILGIYLSDASSKKIPNKDVNTKYLALDSMAKLSKYTTGNKILKDHSNVIITSLRDNDISIRRKSLDLLFLICTAESVKMITKEMLLYFREDEPQLKEDISLKVAILAEKYADDFKWYIDVSLKMIELAGDFLSEDILFRFIQIVTGFENQEQGEQVQQYACEKILKLLEKDFIHENAVRLAAMTLGEFAYTLFPGDVSNHKNYDGIITLLMKHVPVCDASVYLLIFNSLIKFVKLAPGCVTRAIPIFEEHLESWDTELQQRAVEYIILCKEEDEQLGNINEIRDKCFDKMPYFSVEYLNNSVLMKKLAKKDDSLYKKTKEGSEKLRDNLNEKKLNEKIKKSSTKNIQEIIRTDTFAEGSLEKLSESMIGKEIDMENHAFAKHIIFQKNPTSFANKVNKDYNQAIPIDTSILSNNYDHFKAFITNINNAGILYSNDSIEVETKLKTLEKGTLGLMLIFNPRNNSQITDLTLDTLSCPEALSVQISKIKPGTSPQAVVKIKINDSFNTCPVFTLAYKANNNNTNTTFAVPCLINKYIDYYDCVIEDYTTMWYEFSQNTTEEYQRFDSILSNPLDGKKTIMEFLKKLGGLLNSMGFKVFSPNDVSNYHEIEACGIFSYNEVNTIPVLIQASFVPSFTKEFRFSIRSKNAMYSKYADLTLDVYSLVKFFVNPN